MKKIIVSLCAMSVLFLFTGCASIVDGGAKKVQIHSNPSGAKFTIYDPKGKVVESRTTPATVKLDRSGGYFSGIEYKMVFESPGYYSGETMLSSRLNGWYFGNIVFGGLIGILIVDPATGAMFTLPKELNYNLVSSTQPLTPDELKAAQLKANPLPEMKPATQTSHR